MDIDEKHLDELENQPADDVLPNDPPEKPKREAFKKVELPKMSVREAIADAKQKQETKEVKTDDKAKKPVEKQEKAPAKPVKAEPARAEPKDEVGDEEPEAKEVKLAVKVADTTNKYKAPVGWTAEAKKVFDTLPDEVKASVAKREEETSKGFKEYGDKAKTLEQYENIVKQYAPEHQTLGVTAPQLVERTLQWFNALRHTDKAYAINSLKQLARNFGIEKELSESYGSTIPASQDSTTQPDNAEIAKLRQELADLKNGMSQSQAQTAQERVNSWAKDKPHFEKVRNIMRALIESGAVPNKDGWLDLDTAYERAVMADPELAKEKMEAEFAKKETEMQESLAQQEAKRKSDLERAKKANVSLKPSAPTSPAKPKDGPKRKMSVSESIRLAMQEVRGT